MAALSENMLTSELRTRVTNCLDYMEQSHSTAAFALKEAKKLMLSIQASASRLLVQGLL